jgi:hypothetical protein
MPLALQNEHFPKGELMVRRIPLFLIPFALFFLVGVTPAHAACFCSSPTYSNEIGGNAPTCSQLTTDLANSAKYFADLFCSDKGFDNGSCNVQTQLGACTPNPLSPGFIMSGTFSYKCRVCVDRDPIVH